MISRTSMSEQLFNGRERVVREIVDGVLAEQPASFSLVGSKLVGKSRLLQYLASDEGPLLGDDFADWRPYPFQESGRIVVVLVDCGLPDARTDFIGFLCRAIAATIQRETGLAREIGFAPDESGGPQPARLAVAMRRLNERNYRLILLLDSFDRVFAQLPADTVNELRPMTLQAALVVATEQPLHDLDQGLAASPLFNVMTQVFVGLLEDEAARRWLEEYAAVYPGIKPVLNDLLELTGTHPYLLRRMADILAEVKQMLPPGMAVGREHLPLIRLRLAEHGRLLFEMVWRRLQNPPPRIARPVVLSLLQRMFPGPLSIASLTREETAASNWIINQAMVSCTCDELDGKIGYDWFSPLLGDYLAERMNLSQSPALEAEKASTNGSNGSAPKAAPEPARAPAPAELASFENLTRIEAALLGYFQSHSRQVISPEQLLRDVWKRPDATARRVQEAIRRLRLELEQADPPIGTIENDRGRGYRFVPAVETAGARGEV